MEKKKLTIGELLSVLNGNTIILINDSGTDIYLGVCCELKLKYYERNIKFMYIDNDGLLHIDLAFDY